MCIVDNIIILLKAKNVTAKQFCEDLGFNRNKVTDWKAEKSTPDIADVPKIADYFNVSTDYLLGRDEPKKSPVLETEDKFENISAEDKQLDKQLLLLFHKLNRDGKRAVIASAIGVSMLPEYLNVESEEAATQIIA